MTKPQPEAVSRALGRVRRRWEAFGAEDPLWAVLADPAKRGGRWDVDEFFATGEIEIEAALQRLAKLGLQPHRGVALDFGCGVGRLTRALAHQFERAIGVDVSQSMVAEARRLNPDLTFVYNPSPDLAVVDTGSIDFLYSRLVLQHIPPLLTHGYIREFGRVIAAGGVAMFQVPTIRRRRSWIRVVARAVAETLRLRPRDFGGYAIPSSRVTDEIRQAGMRLAEVVDDSTAAGWAGLLYIATRD